MIWKLVAYAGDCDTLYFRMLSVYQNVPIFMRCTVSTAVRLAVRSSVRTQRTLDVGTNLNEKHTDCNFCHTNEDTMVLQPTMS